ncbi:MAG: hypothetical protein LBR98_10110, partial [Syntrophomonadaceae bacterium]|nr:hypothetical protein [Syntrophomonadaceae bacterium]
MVLNLNKKSFLIAVALCLIIALSFVKILNIKIDGETADLTKTETPPPQVHEQAAEQQISASGFFA